MPQNPLKRAIKEYEMLIKEWDEKPLDTKQYQCVAGLKYAISICQRILDESKPCESAPKRWEIGKVFSAEKHNVDMFLEKGWEPYSHDDNFIHFKRLVPRDKEI